MSEKLQMRLKTLAKFLLVGGCNVYIFFYLSMELFYYSFRVT